MAVTIADVGVGTVAYIDINADTSIPIANTIDLQNKSGSVMIIQISTASPADDSTDGYYLLPNEILTLPGTGTDSKWAISAARNGSLMVRDTT